MQGRVQARVQARRRARGRGASSLDPSRPGPGTTAHPSSSSIPSSRIPSRISRTRERRRPGSHRVRSPAGRPNGPGTQVTRDRAALPVPTTQASPVQASLARAGLAMPPLVRITLRGPGPPRDPPVPTPASRPLGRRTAGRRTAGRAVPGLLMKASLMRASRSRVRTGPVRPGQPAQSRRVSTVPACPRPLPRRPASSRRVSTRLASSRPARSRPASSRLASSRRASTQPACSRPVLSPPLRGTPPDRASSLHRASSHRRCFRHRLSSRPRTDSRAAHSSPLPEPVRTRGRPPFPAGQPPARRRALVRSAGACRLPLAARPIPPRARGAGSRTTPTAS